MNTLFDEQSFIAAVTRTGFRGFKPVSVADMYGVAEPGRFGARRIQLAPFGLYASTTHVREAVDRLRRPRTINFHWTVRFDDHVVAGALRELGIGSTEGTTHVLDLRDGYSTLFSRFSTTRRRQVRRASDDGVSVRRATDAASLAKYLEIHRELSAEKSRPVDFPASLFEALIALPETMLLLAERDGVALGGALFFRDGDSLFYWHGAASRAHARSFPSCATFDHAIAYACREGFRTVNFGSSVGVSSLQDFKASWGAISLPYWRFRWDNPVWTALRYSRIVGARFAERVRRRLAANAR